MDADLDLLLTTVFSALQTISCRRPGGRAAKGHRRRGRHPLRQAIMGLPSDRRFLAVAGTAYLRGDRLPRESRRPAGAVRQDHRKR